MVAVLGFICEALGLVPCIQLRGGHCTQCHNSLIYLQNKRLYRVQDVKGRKKYVHTYKHTSNGKTEIKESTRRRMEIYTYISDSIYVCMCIYTCI